MVPSAAPSNREGTPEWLQLPVRLPNSGSPEPSAADPSKKMLTFCMLSVLLGAYMSPVHHAQTHIRGFCRLVLERLLRTVWNPGQGAS